MGKDPAFPFYASDWLGSNKRCQMTLEQQGAYINLLARQWSDPLCSLPDNDQALAMLSEMGQGWLANGCQLVRDCFPPHPNQTGRIANVRLLELRKERDEWTEKSRQGGLKSAENKRLRKAKGGTTTVSTKRQPNANTPSSSSSPSSKSKKKPLTPYDPKTTKLPNALATDAFRAAWAEWCDYRREDKKKPLTPRMVKMQLKEMAEMGAPRAIEAIEYTIGRDWQGLRQPDNPKTPFKQQVPNDEDLATWKP